MSFHWLFLLLMATIATNSIEIRVIELSVMYSSYEVTVHCYYTNISVQ